MSEPETNNRRRPRQLLAALLLACTLTGCRSEAPKTAPQQYQPQGMIPAFNSSDWQAVLTKVVTPEGYVKWDLLRKNDGGVRDGLFRYVALIGAVAPENRPDLFQTNADRLAYWINAYNATCMFGVIQRNYPSNTVASIPPAALYNQDKFLYGGTGMTLDEVETQKVRSTGDPRVHFALNCCSHSCPPLRREPYDPLKLTAQLNEQGARYLNDARAVVRADEATVKLNDIFTNFYTKDFLDAYQKKNGKPGTLLEAIHPYAGKHSPLNGATRVASLGYDWSLNWPPK